MRDCNGEISCSRCRYKCKYYIDYIKEKETLWMLQGEDRQPLKRR